MNDQAPADTIRHAITRLRAHATAATQGQRSLIEIRDPGRFGFPTRVIATWATDTGGEASTGVADARASDAAFIALMNPLVAVALADWLEAELLVHEQAGALALAATSGEVHIGGHVARVEVGLSTLDKALAVARALVQP